MPVSDADRASDDQGTPLFRVRLRCSIDGQFCGREAVPTAERRLWPIIADMKETCRRTMKGVEQADDPPEAEVTEMASAPWCDPLGDIEDHWSTPVRVNERDRQVRRCVSALAGAVTSSAAGGASPPPNCDGRERRSMEAEE